MPPPAVPPAGCHPRGVYMPPCSRILTNLAPEDQHVLLLGEASLPASIYAEAMT
jgi:hypothetical protein